MSELALGQSMSELAFDGAPISDGGFEGSMSDVNDSSESTMRSKACVEIADESGLGAGGGGAALFFRRPAQAIYVN
jgi:hypothetical protein